MPGYSVPLSIIISFSSGVRGWSLSDDIEEYEKIPRPRTIMREGVNSKELHYQSWLQYLLLENNSYTVTASSYEGVRVYTNHRDPLWLYCGLYYNNSDGSRYLYRTLDF